MQLADLDFSKSYTYADYLKWTFEERLELIKGRLFKMSPAPNRQHQTIFREIFGRLFIFLDGRPCEAFSAPFDVRLPRKSKEDKEVITVVQPDICVICDPSKLDEKGCIGAPDIVVEILSPGNNKKELLNKYEVYEESGVKEYWLVVPGEQVCWQYILNEAGKFVASRPLTLGDTITTQVLPGFSINLEEIFAQV